MKYHRCVFKNLQLVFSGSMYALIARIAQNSPVLPQGTAKNCTSLTNSYLVFLTDCENKKSGRFCSMRKDLCFTKRNHKFLRENCPETCGYCKSKFSFFNQEKKPNGVFTVDV